MTAPDAACRYGYIVCEFLLEIWFQIEVISNVAEFDSFKGREITNIGRGLALSMLLAHYMYLLASVSAPHL